MYNKKCQICNNLSIPLDVVDFNKSCIEANGKFLHKSLHPVYYFICEKCGFAFAPELYLWSEEKFKSNIYNAKYELVDPDYKSVRPLSNAKMLLHTFQSLENRFFHLDYGGGSGLLSKVLSQNNWNSKSFDKFYDDTYTLDNLGKFDLITLYEVFEHVVDVHSLMKDIKLLLNENGLVLFSTLLSDGNISSFGRLNWWYASPRNGHISLFSQKSLELLAEQYSFHFLSFNNGLHCFYGKKNIFLDLLIKRFTK